MIFKDFSSHQHGYTLAEMLVTVALVGILSSIALPSYQDYMIRGKIPEATSNLAAKRVQIEQYFLDNRSYNGAPACNNDTAISQYFDFFCTGQENSTTYTLMAVGKGTMAGFIFSIDQSNKKQTQQVPSGWTLPNNDCWVTAKGGRC